MARTTGTKLTDHQQRFVDAYITNGCNAAKAAIAAGYEGENPRQSGYETLTIPYVREVVKERIWKESVTPEVVIGELVGIAQSTDVADMEGMLAKGLSLTELRAKGIDTRNIKEITIRRVEGAKGELPTEVMKLRVQDRQTALVHCGRALMMFGEKRDMRVNAEHRLATDQEVRETLRGILDEADADLAGEPPVPGVQT